MDEKIRTTFSVQLPVRKLLARMAGELDVSMGQVFNEAVNGYLDALDDGTATRPEKNPLGEGHKVVRATIYPQQHARNRLSARASDLDATQGRLMAEALMYYREAIKAGRVPKPSPRTTTAPESRPRAARSRREGETTAKRDTTMPPKKRAANPAITRPLAKPALSDRAECPVCHKQAGVHAVTELLADHIAHPSVRPEGEFRLCDGSGQQPTGPIIHAADRLPEVARRMQGPRHHQAPRALAEGLRAKRLR